MTYQRRGLTEMAAAADGLIMLVDDDLIDESKAYNATGLVMMIVQRFKDMGFPELLNKGLRISRNDVGMVLNQSGVHRNLQGYAAGEQIIRCRPAMTVIAGYIDPFPNDANDAAPTPVKAAPPPNIRIPHNRPESPDSGL